MSKPPVDPMILTALGGLPDDFRDFARTFETEIRPALQAREGDRIAAAEKARKGRWLGIGLGAVVGIGGFAWTEEILVALAGLGLGIAIMIYADQDLQKITGEAKLLLIEPIAKQLNLAFTPDPGSVDIVQRHRVLGLLPSWDRATFEDHLSGERRGVGFELFEAHLEGKRETTDSKGRRETSWVTVFRGQCLRLGVAKSFHGRTLVARDVGIFNRFGGGSGMQRAGLEDPVFERIFEVFTTDQVESRFLLTPDLMQKLVDLEATFHGGKIRCCFDGGDLYIALEGSDLFEPGSMFTPLDKPERIRELLDDFAAIFHLIDQLSTSGRKADLAGGG